MNNNIPPGAVGTLSDLSVWVKERKPEYIVIPKNHTLTHIREFNNGAEPTWKTFHGLEIKYKVED